MRPSRGDAQSLNIAHLVFMRSSYSGPRGRQLLDLPRRRFRRPERAGEAGQQKRTRHDVTRHSRPILVHRCLTSRQKRNLSVAIGESAAERAAGPRAQLSVRLHPHAIARMAEHGAAPEEVEESVCVRVEEAIQGLDGIKRIRSTSSEGSGTVVVELLPGADARKGLGADQEGRQRGHSGRPARRVGTLPVVRHY